MKRNLIPAALITLALLIAFAPAAFVNAAPSAQGSSPGTTNLVSWWSLDEASGTRNDSHSTNHLTDNNTVGSAAGVVSNAAIFVAANSESLSRASNAELQAGDIDFTFGCWVNLTTLAGQHIGGKRSTVSGQSEYLLRWNTSVNRFEWTVYRSTDNAQAVRAENLGSAAIGTWYFIVAWHDATADTISIQVNNGSVDSEATGGALQAASSAAFMLGSTTSGVFQNGTSDECFMYKRVLTADERTWLYNGGAGRAYADLSPSATNTPTATFTPTITNTPGGPTDTPTPTVTLAPSTTPTPTISNEIRGTLPITGQGFAVEYSATAGEIGILGALAAVGALIFIHIVIVIWFRGRGQV